MANKIMPNNLEAEESVLGACFLSKYALQKATESLLPESFYSEKNAKIFTAMMDLAEEKTPIDLTTITSHLKKKNELNEVGGVEYLTEILNFVPTASNVDYYIQNVEETAILRRLIETANDIATEGYRTDETVNEILDSSEKKILSIVKNRKSSEFRSIKDVLLKTQSDLERLSENKSEITGLATGWYDLDKLTTGLHPNEFIIIAARPAMGKTAFALNLATHAAMTQDKSVAVFNLEMSAEQLAMRILSSLGQLEGFKLRTGNLMNNDWKRINEAVSQLSNTNLVIDDTPGITIGEIRAKCRRLASSEKGLSLVIIDYLQLISGGKNYGANRQQEVSDISRSLKTLAMELNVPIIALSQLSRSVEGREDKRPLMSDLRESGSIEQDADIVAFLYRDDYYNKEARTEDNTSISELIIGKHRNGPTATIELLFKKNTSTFLNLKRENKEAN
ncbi:MAG: replicative DNA helicase [Tenericutes bacterium]|jgi:replicative DNA helicase|nr:replicative DNA helicase [Mycoplasmatota bacterium]MDD6941225.1 replicative DNA helicase [bacterium]MDY2697246.1 replicative DNA helicase [Bacilli bacterium]MDY5992876.1 replicative DNA helicase [Bacilli bacterium]